MKARKTRHLGKGIARQLCRLVGPLNGPHQNGANGPVDSMVKRVVLARAVHTRLAQATRAHSEGRQVHTGAWVCEGSDWEPRICDIILAFTFR